VPGTLSLSLKTPNLLGTRLPQIGNDCIRVFLKEGRDPLIEFVDLSYGLFDLRKQTTNSFWFHNICSVMGTFLEGAKLCDPEDCAGYNKKGAGRSRRPL
jgi:hypothetical protein